MKTKAEPLDCLKQYLEIHDDLMRERASMEERIRQIDGVLAAGLPGSPKAGALASPRKRVKNKMSLRDAVLQVTKKKALSKQEILEQIEEIGYRFTSTSPINSLNAVLYSKGQFKNQKGKFSPTK